MRISSKGCTFVMVQKDIIQCGDQQHEIHCTPNDGELYIFEEGRFMSLQVIQYQDISRRKKRTLSANNFELVIEKCQQYIQSEECRDIYIKKIVCNFVEMNRAELFRGIYSLNERIYELEHERAVYIERIRTEEKIIEDLKKQLYQQGKNPNVHIIDTSYIEELENQFIKGQMKWAQIDMDNASLQFKVKQLKKTIEIQEELIVNFQKLNNTNISSNQQEICQERGDQ